MYHKHFLLGVRIKASKKKDLFTWNSYTYKFFLFVYVIYKNIGYKTLCLIYQKLQQFYQYIFSYSRGSIWDETIPNSVYPISCRPQIFKMDKILPMDRKMGAFGIESLLITSFLHLAFFKYPIRLESDHLIPINIPMEALRIEIELILIASELHSPYF